MDKVLQNIVDDFFLDADETVSEGKKELKKEELKREKEELKREKNEKIVKKYIFVKNVMHDNIFYEIGTTCPNNLSAIFLKKDFIKSE